MSLEEPNKIMTTESIVEKSEKEAEQEVSKELKPEVVEKTEGGESDESDLDDLLDDALNDFSKPAVATQLSSPALSPKLGPDADSQFEEEFARQLSLEMEGMLGDLSNEEGVKATLAKLMSGHPGGEEGSAPPRPSSNPTSSEANTSKYRSGTDFQSAISDTMNKLKTSSDQVEAEAKKDNPEDLMEQLMRQMEGFSDSPDFEKAIEGMMGQIMTKDLLYEPMKDLTDKYPEWLESNQDKLTESERTRYTKQNEIVAEVVRSFEEQITDDQGEVTECDKNTQLQKRVMELMQEMQDLGQPPADLLKLISPDLEVGPDGQPKMPKEMEDCSVM